MTLLLLALIAEKNGVLLSSDSKVLLHNGQDFINPELFRLIENQVVRVTSTQQHNGEIRGQLKPHEMSVHFLPDCTSYYPILPKLAAFPLTTYSLIIRQALLQLPQGQSLVAAYFDTSYLLDAQYVRRRFNISSSRPICVLILRDTPWQKNHPRNVDPYQYIPLIKRLISDGFYCIRLGASKNSLPICSEYYQDLSHHWSVEYDISLLSVASLCVCSQSGLSLLAPMMGVDTIITNVLDTVITAYLHDLPNVYLSPRASGQRKSEGTELLYAYRQYLELSKCQGTATANAEFYSSVSTSLDPPFPLSKCNILFPPGLPTTRAKRMWSESLQYSYH